MYIENICKAIRVLFGTEELAVTWATNDSVYLTKGYIRCDTYTKSISRFSKWMKGFVMDWRSIQVTMTFDIVSHIRHVYHPRRRLSLSMHLFFLARSGKFSRAVIGNRVVFSEKQLTETVLRRRQTRIVLTRMCGRDLCGIVLSFLRTGAVASTRC